MMGRIRQRLTSYVLHFRCSSTGYFIHEHVRCRRMKRSQVSARIRLASKQLQNVTTSLLPPHAYSTRSRVVMRVESSPKSTPPLSGRSGPGHTIDSLCIACDVGTNMNHLSASDSHVAWRRLAVVLILRRRHPMSHQRRKRTRHNAPRTERRKKLIIYSEAIAPLSQCNKLVCAFYATRCARTFHQEVRVAFCSRTEGDIAFMRPRDGARVVVFFVADLFVFSFSAVPVQQCLVCGVCGR